MLVEFRVTNFRSIKDEQVFSLVASKDKFLRETNTSETGLKAVPNVLRSAAIYGANASGKSNLIKALRYMRTVVLHSAMLKTEGGTFNVTPFMLEAESRSLPTEFEITFLIDGIRHQFGFSMTKERIMSEYLYVYKNFKPQKWFHRYFNEKTGRDVYDFKSGLRGPKHVWREATRQDALFCSVATQLNSADMKPIHDWFSNKLVIFPEIGTFPPHYTADLCIKNQKQDVIADFIKSADIHINKISVSMQKREGHTISVDTHAGSAEVSQGVMEELKISFYHPSDDGDISFDFDDESRGTQVLFALAGPIMNILSQGEILVIDELDNSLHPYIVRELISLFHSDKNAKMSQLIFSTHDVSLLDTFGLFRRDQIWFTEKTIDQATELVSLAEFIPISRKRENIEQNYLAGQYGGVPLIDHELRLKNHDKEK